MKFFKLSVASDTLRKVLKIKKLSRKKFEIFVVLFFSMIKFPFSSKFKNNSSIMSDGSKNIIARLNL